MVFQKSQNKSILQVMFRGTFWIRSWSILSKEDGRSILKEGRMSNVGDGGAGDLSQIWMECSKAYWHLDFLM
jgi:hypothetical protein